MKKLLDQSKLHASGVVANNLMNRERVCRGGNSYAKDLAFDPIEFLEKRLTRLPTAAWLDVCCGEGRALIEAARHFDERAALRIVGIDLAGGFRARPLALSSLTLLETPVEAFEPSEKFDLITIVHGLHYLGDKLAAIRRAAGWLKADGLFLAHLDPANLKLAGRPPSGRIFLDFFNKNGFTFDRRKHLLALRGGRTFESKFEYLGADDRTGPNYTRQPAVDSYYDVIPT